MSSMSSIMLPTYRLIYSENDPVNNPDGAMRILRYPRGIVPVPPKKHKCWCQGSRLSSHLISPAGVCQVQRYISAGRLINRKKTGVDFPPLTWEIVFSYLKSWVRSDIIDMNYEGGPDRHKPVANALHSVTFPCHKQKVNFVYHVTASYVLDKVRTKVVDKY